MASALRSSCLTSRPSQLTPLSMTYCKMQPEENKKGKIIQLYVCVYLYNILPFEILLFFSSTVLKLCFHIANNNHKFECKNRQKSKNTKQIIRKYRKILNIQISHKREFKQPIPHISIKIAIILI